jgi:hypothetical protein
MHVKALRQANVAFDHAKHNLSDLKAANDFQTIERHWLAFLDNANRVFTRLEQAANATRKGKAWWGSQVHEWKTDPLLQYIRQARDVGHHTIQEVAQHHPGRATPITNASPEELAEVHQTVKRMGKPHYAVLGGFEVVWPHVECLNVVNRGVEFKRPKSHLGHPILATTPADIGDLTIIHLEKMIAKTASFG